MGLFLLNVADSAGSPGPTEGRIQVALITVATCLIIFSSSYLWSGGKKKTIFLTYIAPQTSAMQQASPDLEQREAPGSCQLESPCHHPPSGDHGFSL